MRCGAQNKLTNRLLLCSSPLVVQRANSLDTFRTPIILRRDGFCFPQLSGIISRNISCFLCNTVRYNLSCFRRCLWLVKSTIREKYTLVITQSDRKLHKSESQKCLLMFKKCVEFVKRRVFDLTNALYCTPLIRLVFTVYGVRCMV